MTEIKYINERGIKRVGKLIKGHNEEKIKEGFLAVLHKAGYTVYVHPSQVIEDAKTN